MKQLTYEIQIQRNKKVSELQKILLKKKYKYIEICCI